MKHKLPPLLALLLPIAAPFLAAAQGIVLEVPVAQANMGGVGAAGASLTAPLTSLTGPGGLTVPTIDGQTLPSVETPNLRALPPGQKAVNGGSDIRVQAAPGKALPAGGEEISPANSAPKLGSEGFQKALSGFQDGSGKLQGKTDGESAGGIGAEQSAGISAKLFDGSGNLPASGKDDAVAPGGAGRNGFQGPSGYNFIRSLAYNGVPNAQIQKLADILKTQHPGDQKKVYHGLLHSKRVADTMAGVLAGPAGSKLSRAEKALLLVAAALHDVDPRRTPGTPARVSATLEYLDTDPAARALFKDLGLGDRGRGQLKALIKFTDFNPDQAAMAQIQQDAEQMAKTYFGEALAAKWTTLGRLLAYADQTAMYLDSAAFADSAVKGLAHEFRTMARAATPTDDMVRKGTSGFLKPLLENPFFNLLPPNLRANFQDVYAHFRRAAGLQAPSLARAPPAPVKDNLSRSIADAVDPFKKAAGRFLAYERSLMGGMKPSAKQHRGLFTLWLSDESGIKPNSELGRALLTRFFPQEATAKSGERAKVEASYQHIADLIVELGQQAAVTTQRVQELIAKDPEIDRLLRSNRDEKLARRILVQILQRDRVERLTAGFPHNAQGDFLREMGQDILTPSGKSIEEISRAGAFAYVNFNGNAVRDAKTGRDPDNRSADQVFYVVLESDGRWTIGGYRKNMKRAGTDAEYVRIFRKWLVAGGIPEGVFSPSMP
ncbi:MAG: hypothetical protein ABIJ96_06555 [Elusimicrobiota bacterium]